MKLLCWPDVSVKTGLGHLMRLVALAQKIPDAEFYCDSLPTAVAVLKKNGFSYHEMPNSHAAEAFLSLIQKIKPDWVILDGYSFDQELRRQIRAAGVCLLSMDDNFGEKPQFSHVIVNQNGGAGEEVYSNLGAQVLAGSDYCLLRNDILKIRTGHKNIPDIAQNILLTFGGSDPNNETESLLKLLSGFMHPLRVVLGPSNPHVESIKKLKLPDHITIEVGTPISELITWADLAITAGGVTSYELAYAGVPMIVLPIVTNQNPVVAGLVAAGAGVTTAFDQVPQVLEKTIHDKPARQKMSAAGQKMIDGQGRDRIVQVMQNILKGTK